MATLPRARRRIRGPDPRSRLLVVLVASNGGKGAIDLVGHIVGVHVPRLQGRLDIGPGRAKKPQEEMEVPVTKRALVIGGGVAGIEAALELADAGHKVTLVEKEASIGGIMAQLDKTYPTMDCSI